MTGAGPAIASMISSYQRVSHNVKNKFHSTQNDKRIELSSKKENIIKTVNLQIASDKLLKSKKICPECQKNFFKIRVDDLEIDCCIFCNSLWFDFGELKSLTGLSKDIPSDGLRDRNSKYKCPVCNKRMFEKVFMKKSNLLVDVCNEHGVYLENGELKRAFILSEKM